MKLKNFFYSTALSLLSSSAFGATHIYQSDRAVARANRAVVRRAIYVARTAAWAALVSSIKITAFNDLTQDFLSANSTPTIKHFVEKPNKPLCNNKQNAKRHNRAHIKRTIQQPRSKK